MNRYVKVCPKCGSTNIGWGDKTRYGATKDICKDCGYGQLDFKLIPFPEVDNKDIKKFKENLKKKS